MRSKAKNMPGNGRKLQPRAPPAPEGPISFLEEDVFMY